MKLETTARHLAAALKTVGKVIERCNTYPMLACALFDGKTVAGTNLDQIIRVDIPATKGTGRAAIDARSLQALVTYIPGDETVQITATADTAKIEFCGNRYELPCLDPEGFEAAFPKGWEGKTASKTSGALNPALRFVAPAISTEATRYYLNGVCVSRDREKRQVLVATDGHKLGAHPAPFEAPFLDNVIIPRRAVALIAAMPDEMTIEAIEDQPNALRLRWPGVTLVTKLIEGSFPDWRRVVPEQGPNTKRVQLDRKASLGAARRLRAIQGVRSGNGVDLAFNQRECVLAAKSAEGREGVEYLVAFKALPGEIGAAAIAFNPRYLETILGMFARHETVEMAFESESSPARITTPDHGAFAVLMPMRGLAANALNELSSASIQEAAE